MPTANNVTRMLAAQKIEFEIHELPNKKLSGLEAADYLGIDPAQMFKTILALHPQGGKAILALVPAPTKVDMKALGKAIDAKKALSATQAQAEKLTGLQSGGISPLALIGKGFSVVLDASALNFPHLYLSAGQRGLNVSLAPSALISITKAHIATISIH
jgi:Cys-tRNA(Pro)/Cys-tRNA(Cys) deacylase